MSVELKNGSVLTSPDKDDKLIISKLLIDIAKDLGHYPTFKELCAHPKCPKDPNIYARLFTTLAKAYTEVRIYVNEKDPDYLKMNNKEEIIKRLVNLCYSNHNNDYKWIDENEIKKDPILILSVVMKEFGGIKQLKDAVKEAIWIEKHPEKKKSFYSKLNASSNNSNKPNNEYFEPRKGPTILGNINDIPKVKETIPTTDTTNTTNKSTEDTIIENTSINNESTDVETNTETDVETKETNNEDDYYISNEEASIDENDIIEAVENISEETESSIEESNEEVESNKEEIKSNEESTETINESEEENNSEDTDDDEDIDIGKPDFDPIDYDIKDGEIVTGRQLKSLKASNNNASKNKPVEETHSEVTIEDTTNNDTIDNTIEKAVENVESENVVENTTEDTNSDDALKNCFDGIDFEKDNFEDMFIKVCKNIGHLITQPEQRSISRMHPEYAFPTWATINNLLGHWTTWNDTYNIPYKTETLSKRATIERFSHIDANGKPIRSFDSKKNKPVVIKKRVIVEQPKVEEVEQPKSNDENTDPVLNAIKQIAQEDIKNASNLAEVFTEVKPKVKTKVIETKPKTVVKPKEAETKEIVQMVPVTKSVESTETVETIEYPVKVILPKNVKGSITITLNF